MNKLLLVDDEKVFLTSLKTGLTKFESVFQTDICFSVQEAINKINDTEYGLIITDIRMPVKSGIDLLLHLKKINFSGGIKVMSAHNTEDNIEKINALGIVDVIPKPVDLNWFQDMLINFFKEETSVEFELIDLLSVMQVINIDKKSSALQIDLDDKQGFIYFKDGELINAEYENFKGEEAVLQLISLKTGNISVKKLKKKVKRIINIPFVEFIMNIMKKKDELRHKNNIEYKEDEVIQDKELYEELLGEEKLKIKTEEKMSNTAQVFSESLESLSETSGFKAAGIYNSSGDVLAHLDRGEFHFEDIGSLAIELYLSAKSISDKMGIGECNFVETHTEEYVFIHMCVVPGKGAMGVLLGKDGNVGLARHQMRKEGKKLIPEFD